MSMRLAEGMEMDTSPLYAFWIRGSWTPQRPSLRLATQACRVTLSLSYLKSPLFEADQEVQEIVLAEFQPKRRGSLGGYDVL